MSKSLRVNDEIRSAEIMFIDETGKSFGRLNFDQAMWLASEKELDLVEVGPNAIPPVVKLLDFGKYQYEQAKAESKGRAHAPGLKEIRLTLKIGKHDFDVKRNQADHWLQDGDRVRVTVTLYGREMMYPDQAKEMIDRMRLALEAHYEVDISKMGKRFSAIVGRKKAVGKE